MLINIIKAITSEINEVYNGLDIYVSRELVQPSSFFVELDNIKATGYLYNQEMQATARIYYRASIDKGYELELLQVQETLKSIFNLKLKVDNRYLNIDNLNYTTIENELYFSFNLNYFENNSYSYGYDNSENMQDILLGGI